ncbi:MAG: hypothetical protein OXE04_01935 [bacterium]|nr:hypothetical protein [bacterium]
MPSGRRKKQPNKPPPVFFLDRSLGRHLIAKAILAKGYKVLTMTEVYPNGTDQRVADPDWMLKADQEDWITLTKDYSVIRDHRNVLATTTLRVFAYNNANITGPKMVERLETNFNRILQKANKPGPYVYVIGRDNLELRWQP